MATQQRTRRQDDGTREQLFRLLLDKVEQDQYPSSTMLDMIEKIVTPDELPEYTEMLMAKIEGEQYPSYDLIQRLDVLS